MTQNTPNWDSISETIGFLKNTVEDFVEEFKEDLTAAAFPDKVEEEAVHPTTEVVRLLKQAETALNAGESEKAKELINLADRYQILASYSG